jgi:DNA-binding transcriptional MerR regulator
MSTQQLDLFGFPIAAESTTQKQAPIIVKPTIIELVDLPIVAQAPTLIATYETIEPVKEKSKRGRKPKPKLPKSDIKAKRGRKSYTETYSDTDLIDVPSEEKLQEKLYYPISQVAKWFNLTASQLRFWEGEFDILQPRKNKKGDRLFRPEDILNLKTIYYLLRNKKMTIEGAKDYLKANQNKTQLEVQLQQSLNNFKSFLLELKANLN